MLQFGLTRHSPSTIRDAPETLRQDIELVKDAIRIRYGFDVTDVYAADFVAFVEALIES